MQERPLADCELGSDPDSEQARLFLANVGAVVGAQLFGRDPALPVEPDVLPLVLTDRTALGRLSALRVLDAAGLADEGGHELILVESTR